MGEMTVAIARDPHVTMTLSEALKRGCTCEYGCPTCGMEASQMGNCPAWSPCPIGREADDNCPLVVSETTCTRL